MADSAALAYTKTGRYYAITLFSPADYYEECMGRMDNDVILELSRAGA